MAERSGKDHLTRIADVGEGAIQRFGEMPGVGRVAEPFFALRERVDDLARRVRAIDELERRLTEAERRLNALETKPSRRPRTATRSAPRAAETPRAATAATRARRRTEGTPSVVRPPDETA